MRRMRNWRWIRTRPNFNWCKASRKQNCLQVKLIKWWPISRFQLLVAPLLPSSQTSTRSFLDWGVSFIIKRLHLSKWSQRRRIWIKVAMLGIWPRRRPIRILSVPLLRGKTWKFSTLLSWTFLSKTPAPVSMRVKLMWNRTPIITAIIHLQGQCILRSSIRAAIMSNKRPITMNKKQKRCRVL